MARLSKPDLLIEQVVTLIQEVSASTIEPRFSALTDTDVMVKSAGEVVTVADQEAEKLLTAGLKAILPNVPIVGEEACAVDSGRLDAMKADRVWLVDPLDGTANFVAGSPDWAVMVALVVTEATVLSWIWQPLTQRIYLAERGSGASCNGFPLRSYPRSAEPGDLCGAVLTRFLDPVTKVEVAHNSSRFGVVTGGHQCSGIEYPALIEGTEDFVLFWRTLPWDHAPGVLLVQEAGGVAYRLDGTAYRPADEGHGLLVAGDQPTWEMARTLLA